MKFLSFHFNQLNLGSGEGQELFYTFTYKNKKHIKSTSNGFQSGLQIINILTMTKILVQLMPAIDYPFGGPNGIQARSWTTQWIQISYKNANT